jgi:hypothetical protein
MGCPCQEDNGGDGVEGLGGRLAPFEEFDGQAAAESVGVGRVRPAHGEVPVVRREQGAKSTDLGEITVGAALLSSAGGRKM